jgi:hypothetical protein
MELKYNTQTLAKIEAILKAGQYVVRYEKGHFTSGYCVLKDKKVVVINKFFDTEARINCIVDILDQLEIDTADLKDEKLLELFQKLQQKRIRH